MRGVFHFLTVAALAMIPLSAVLAQSAPVREITHVAGDLYRFQNNAHVSVFLVTDEGVIATDPISEDAARWLEAEITKRFGKEIRYAIYSHSDADHVSGGQVFDDTATIVAQEKAKPVIEAGDYTAVPEETFERKHVVELGGKRVELYYFGPSHTDNLIAMRFPDERAVFVVDVLSVKRLPYRTMGSYHMPEAIRFIEGVEALDFDILIPGHGPMGVKADAAAHREYLEALMAAVKDARERGLSLAQAKAEITLDAYRDWSQYDAWREENIEGMYRLPSEK